MSPTSARVTCPGGSGTAGCCGAGGVSGALLSGGGGGMAEASTVSAV
ncbi:hypothetical protein P378_04010 [Desulforamulus profundi]|uniref:Uncharacterized protein n=1 Tax=Desulforamulus profundi TaxID=1383067 RepID=A0A2C6MIJ4_9FIRM|nr:hypothetical protein P378_04010 [Desulforamulus profundi]